GRRRDRPGSERARPGRRAGRPSRSARRTSGGGPTGRRWRGSLQCLARRRGASMSEPRRNNRVHSPRTSTPFGFAGKLPTLRLPLRTVRRVRPELFLDPQELVVLCYPVAAARAAGLNLAGVGRYGYIGNGCVLGLAAAVRDDGGPAVALGHPDGGEGLGQRADL